MAICRRRHWNSCIVIRITLSCRFFPMEIELWWSPGRTIINALTLTTGHKQLHCRIELRNLTLLLISPILVNTIFYADSSLFQFNHSNGNAIDIDNDIWSAMFGVHSLFSNRNFLCYTEDIIVRIFPVNQHDLLIRQTGTLAYRHRVACIVNVLITIIQRLLTWTGCIRFKLIDSFRGLRTR